MGGRGRDRHHHEALPDHKALPDLARRCPTTRLCPISRGYTRPRGFARSREALPAISYRRSLPIDGLVGYRDANRICNKCHSGGGPLSHLTTGLAAILKGLHAMHAFVRGSTLVQPLRVAVPFVFSYLAMPVRQMLSGVVLDCSAPIRCRSAVGDEPGLVSYVLPYVLPYLLTHVPEKWGDELVTEWCPGRHYRGCQAEKNTRYACACCRSQKKFKRRGLGPPVASDWSDARPRCDVCYAGWDISMVSRNWLHEARKYAREWKRCYCGKCDESWFISGWICKGAVAMEGVQKKRTQTERELFRLHDNLFYLNHCIDNFFSVSRTRRHEDSCIGV